jgi:cytochrome c
MTHAATLDQVRRLYVLPFNRQSRYGAQEKHFAFAITRNGTRGSMNFELNKIFGALLAVGIFVMGIGFIAQSLYASRLPPSPAYVITVPDAPAPDAGGGDAPVEPIAARLAKANVGKGEAAHKPCVACHAFEKGGANKQGPALWGVVGNQKGVHDGYKYSATLADLSSKGEKWTFENLDGFLTNPKKYSPGTTMGYAGISDPQKRADLIAWLREQDDAPEALPAP